MGEVPAGEGEENRVFLLSVFLYITIQSIRQVFHEKNS